MLRITNFEKFCSIIDNFKASGIQVKIFGNREEIYIGWLSDKPCKANTLQIRLVAMTSIGTIYCNENIKIDDSELIKQAETLINSLEIINADVSFGDGNGRISIK